MVVVSEVESTRLELQNRLDAEKTQAERNRLGQFATPAPLATDILEYARSLLPADERVRFLDPAIGTGSFYSALLRSFAPARIAEATGYEIDPHYGQEAAKLWHNMALYLHVTDFTRATPPDSDDAKANLLICNPPYVRHHHLPGHEKVRLQRLAERMAGVKLSGLAGLYCYFLCLSHGWMAENALAGWLIPSEFMDVNYGQQIKKYLLSRVTLLRIDRFEPHDVQFGDALVSSAVVWFKRVKPDANHAIEFTYGGTLIEPRVSRFIPANTLHRAPKWTVFPHATAGLEGEDAPLKLSDLFTIKRGLATGANEFFVLTPKQISMHRLPREFLTPILPSPRYLPNDEIEADCIGDPILDRQLFLLTCNLPDADVRLNYPELWKYLQIAVETGISKRYLCMHRSPWYAQEDRPAAPFLCTYMGRQDSKVRKPFRFILNHSKATAPNVYLMLYPKPALARLLKDDPRLLRSVWQALNDISTETLVNEGRVYGGGLHKMEPKELANAPASGIVAALPRVFDREPKQMVLFAD